MAPSEPPSEITLRVKVPPGHIEGGSDEFTLGTLPTRSKIGEVRSRIQQTLPSNPGPERQRLLYAGRALIDNDQTLTDALNTRRDTSQTEYVIHLLVKGEQGIGQSASSAGGHMRSTSTPNAARVGTPQGATNAAHHHHHHLPGIIPGMPQGGPPGLPQPGHVNPQQAQLFALQQRQAQLQLQMQMQQRMMQQQQQQHPLGMPHVHGQIPHVHHAPAQHAPLNADQQNLTGHDPAARQPSNTMSTNGGDGPQRTPSAGPRLDSPNAAGGQPQGTPGRPISGQGFHLHGVGADGNRFEIHQQTMNFPLGGPHGQQLPFPMGLPQLPGIGLPFPMPGMAQQHNLGAGMPPPASGALERARQNVTDMRRMVDEMRSENATEEQRVRMARLQENIDAVNNYIDPFGVGQGNGGSRSNSPMPPGGPTNVPAMNARIGGGLQHRMPHFGMPSHSRTATSQQAPSSSDVTCYLLSSPRGPQALLLSPMHVYTGTLANNTRSHLTPGQSTGFRQAAQMSGQPTPTPTQPLDGAAGAVEQAGQVAVPQGQPQVPAQAQAQAPAAAEAGGPLQALLNHFWLLFRVLLFAYFLLGANMGWRRPIAMLLISAGFWMIRNGLFGDGGVARRWWDGIVRVDQGGQQGVNPVAANEQLAEGQMPTPEQVAARILRDREEAARRTPLGRARELVRPAERAAALFFASLWPGVGEAHVRAREAEERRLAEAEVERRRLEEEAKREAEEKEKESEQIEGGEAEKAVLGGGEAQKQDLGAVGSGSAGEGNDLREHVEREKGGIPSAG